MNKRDFNVVGNEGTDNQELAKGIANSKIVLQGKESKNLVIHFFI